MANSSVFSRIFPILELRKRIFLKVEHIRLISSVTRRNSYPIVSVISNQIRVIPNNNCCLSLRALKHTSKFSRGKGEKVVDEDEEEDENALIDISV